MDDATGETWRTVYSAADDPKSIPHSLDANGAGGEEEDAKEKLSNFYLNKISISPFLWDHPQPWWRPMIVPLSTEKVEWMWKGLGTVLMAMKEGKDSAGYPKKLAIK